MRLIVTDRITWSVGLSVSHSRDAVWVEVSGWPKNHAFGGGAYWVRRPLFVPNGQAPLLALRLFSALKVIFFFHFIFN